MAAHNEPKKPATPSSKPAAGKPQQAPANKPASGAPMPGKKK